MHITRTDILLLVGILAASVLFLLAVRIFSADGRRVVVSVDGVVRETYSLDRDLETTIRTDAGYNVLRIREGNVSVTEADCPDRICVKHSEIRKAGETILCLPHKLAVEIQGGEDE